MADREAGARLKQAIHVAREQAGIPSDLQLALAAGVHYDTLMNWYRGATTPRGAEVMKVAKTLDTPFDSLMGAYEGRKREPNSAEAELRAHREAMERQTAAIERLLRVLTSGAVAAGVLRALEEGDDEPPPPLPPGTDG